VTPRARVRAAERAQIVSIAGWIVFFLALTGVFPEYGPWSVVAGVGAAFLAGLGGEMRQKASTPQRTEETV
jgi:uncharacterized membrane protein